MSVEAYKTRIHRISNQSKTQKQWFLQNKNKFKLKKKELNFTFKTDEDEGIGLLLG